MSQMQSLQNQKNRYIYIAPLRCKGACLFISFILFFYETIDNCVFLCYNTYCCLGVAQMVACLNGVQEAGSSSLPTQTKASKTLCFRCFFLFLYKLKYELTMVKNIDIMKLNKDILY